jgi:hypothetical protein
LRSWALQLVARLNAIRGVVIQWHYNVDDAIVEVNKAMIVFDAACGADAIK